MSDATIEMSDKQHVSDSRVEPGGSAVPAWWLVFTRELADLWIGGKALNLILIYTILLGVITYVLASNSELSLIPPKEMVYETLKVAIAVALFISLVIGADSFSGERERATFEGLLLTPTSRRQIVLGKFLAAISPWPAALIVSVPYLFVLAQGDEVFGQAVFWGAILGSVLAPAYAGVGMLVSFWSNSNKTSFFASLGIYVLFLVPAQLPGRAQTGASGQFLQWVNPVAAANHFLSKILTNNRTLEEFWPWLQAPAVFALLILGLLFLYAAPGLRLEAGKTSRFWSYLARVAGLAAFAGLMLSLSASPAMAFQEAQPQTQALQIAIDMDYAVVKAGDPVFYNTLVSNNGAEASPSLTVAMNIINLDAEGDVVDPEDWSPERTQYIEELGPGQSAELSWRVNSILDGDYMVYMVVIPEPDGQERTSQPVASSGIHLTVTPFTRLNPGGVLPYAIGGPIVLGLAVLLVYRRRRRGIDMGGATLLAFGAVIGILVTACRAPLTTPNSADNAAVASQGSATGQDVRPGTEEFGLTREELVTSIETIETLIASCMSEAGFEYIANDYNTVRQGMTADKTLPGLSEEAFFEQYGFGISTLYTGLPPQLAEVALPAQIGLGEQNVQIFRNLSPEDQVAYNRTLFGENTEATLAVALETEDLSRTGGCTRSAIEEVFTTEQLNMSYTSPKDVLIEQDPRMVAALAEYAECIQAAGFDYNHEKEIEPDLRNRLDAITDGLPLESLSPEAREALTALQGEERAIAVASYECESEILEPVEDQVERELFAGQQ